MMRWLRWVAPTLVTLGDPDEDDHGGSRHTVTEVRGGLVVQDDAKTRSAGRSLAIDTTTVEVLRRWKRQQAEERLAAGPAWQDTGLVSPPRSTGPDDRLPARQTGVTAFDSVYSILGERSAPFGHTMVPAESSTLTWRNRS